MKYNIVTQKEASSVSWRRFNELRRRDWELPGIDIGHHDLNLMIGGIVPGKLTSLAGRSGMGKTSVLVQTFNKGGIPRGGKRGEFMFFTWEMESSYLIDRHVSHETGLSSRMLSQGAKLITDDYLPNIRQAYDRVSKLPVHYQQMSLDINQVEVVFNEFVQQCRDKSKVEGIEVVPIGVIDYISLAKFESSGLLSYGIRDFMSRLKNICTKHMASFLVLVQIARSADDYEFPRKQDISDSKSIEDNSDNLILMHRPEYNGIETVTDPKTGEQVESEGKAFFRIWKSRDFGTGDALVNCDIPKYRFWNREHTWDYDYYELYKKEEFWRKVLLGK